MVALGDVINAAGPRAGKGSELPVYAVTKHAGFVPSLKYFKKQVFSRDTASYRKVEPGDFAYATIHLDEGSIGIAPEAALISPMYTVFRADESRVDPNYLIRLLKAPQSLAAYAGMGRGAVHRRKAISLDTLRSMQIPLPDLAEQRRIAAILDQADAICRRQHYVIKRLESLGRERFNDWLTGFAGRTVRIADLLHLKSGTFLPASQQDGGAYPVYGGNGITGHHSEHLFDSGQVIIGRVGAYCGAVHVTDSPAWITDNALYVAEIREPVGTRFLAAALGHANLNQFASRSGQPLISASRIAHVELPVPAPAESEAFERFAVQTEAMLTNARSLMLQFDALFTSLQHRAFRGEL